MAGLATVDDLVWSVTPKPDPRERGRLRELLPDLVERLKEGMRELSIPDEARRALLGPLARVHFAAIRTGEIPAVDVAAATPPAAASVPVEECAPVTIGEDASADGSDPGADLAHQALCDRVREAVEHANAEVHATAQSRVQCHGMGTTIVVAVFRDDRVTVAHVGDSRLYRLRGDRLDRITTDHSMREDMVRRGFYTPEEAAEKIAKNIITRAVGADPTVEVEVQQVYAMPGDGFLACSDGLSDLVDEATIADLLDHHSGDLDAAARALVDAANEAGGRDNITVALAHVVGAFPAGEDEELADSVRVAGLTDVGRKRSHNEDALGIDARHGVVVLADGMGGCNAGEIASAMTVQTVMAALVDSDAAVTPETADGDEDPAYAAKLAAINSLFWEDDWTEASVASGAHAAAEAQSIAASHAMVDLESLFAEAGTDEIEAIELGGNALPETADPVARRFVDLVRSLKVGMWVEFRPPAGEPTRARLTWLSPSSGHYLFTDRKGVKIADATLHGLAVEFRRGAVVVLDDVPLFDRALGALTARIGDAGQRGA